MVAAWQYTGFMMVLVLAGLQGVPDEIYQAAALDGARGVRAFWYITLPSIRNILIVAVLITTIGAFKVFDLIYVTTQGGPANATQVLGTYIYVQAFMHRQHGLRRRHRGDPPGDRRRPRLAPAQIFAAGMMQAAHALPRAHAGDVRLRRASMRCSCCCRWSGWCLPPSRPSARSSSIPLGLPDTLTFSAFGRSWAIGLGIFLLNSALVTFLSVAAHRHRQRHGRLRPRPLRDPLDALALSAGGRLLSPSRSTPCWCRSTRMISAAGMLNSRLAIVLPLRRLRHPVHDRALLRLLPRFPEGARGRRAARQLQPRRRPSSA